MNLKPLKMKEHLGHLAAEFLQRESSGQSLITVTNVLIDPKMLHASILISVFPAEKEKIALEFVRRKRSDFKEYIYEHSRIGRLPLIDFKIDTGEKNRQRIDEIERNM